MSNTRRDFLTLSLLMGMMQTFSHRAFASLLPTPDEEDPNIYAGPLIDRIQDLLAPMHRREISPESALAEIERRYQDLDITHELNAFLQTTAEDLSLVTLKLKTGSWKSKMQLQLFAIPQGHSHAPHGHDGLSSYQTLVQGRLQLREFERRRDIKDAMILSPLPSRVALPLETFATSHDHHNVHWFGAEQSALILNVNLIHKDRAAAPGLLIADSASRIYVDPTGALNNGEIVAPVMSHDEGMAKFRERLPLDAADPEMESAD